MVADTDDYFSKKGWDSTWNILLEHVAVIAASDDRQSAESAGCRSRSALPIGPPVLHPQCSRPAQAHEIAADRLHRSAQLQPNAHSNWLRSSSRRFSGRSNPSPKKIPDMCDCAGLPTQSSSERADSCAEQNISVQGWYRRNRAVEYRSPVAAPTRSGRQPVADRPALEHTK